ncbi:extracellular solute-binding protein [Streptacidiphilus sp. P02-A3a]|uniref:ABC transporter substrate-binding protein n=1 Tax=Streptacidiphilus sp. P02-A3a TaxID=2704468 RepID=UPI0015F87B5B|nr:extracellular solute-binding protein [Streptacidiphilus sp. P02-A3a]QMU71570.1 extracellular solute-binding protein [Streptacidiphilus sp. P02-A3a]
MRRSVRFSCAPGARRRAVVTAAAVALAATGLSACGGITPGAGSQVSAAPTGAVSTAIPTGKVTLTVVSSENSGTTKALAAAFEQLHPNVTVDYQYTDVNDYNTSLNLTLSSDNAPDLALLNMIGTTVKANLVRDLDPYAAAYGWTTTEPSTELDQWRADATGTQLGSGHLWAAPAGFSVVGVYYNQRIAAKLGIAPPTTFAEFQADLAKAKAAGQLPIQLGNLAGHSSFIFQSVADDVDGAAKSTNWAYGVPGASIDSPGGTAAAQDLAAWAKQGYTPPGANGTDLPGSVADFSKGQGLFLFDGSWDAATLSKAMPGNVGFFPLPGATATSPVTGIGTSVAYAIPTRAKNPDLAAAFLDFMGSAQAAQIEFTTGFMPVAHADTVTAPSGSVLGQVADAWGKVGRDNGLVPFFNNSTATMNTTLTSAGQELIGGKVTPTQYLAQLQADWQKGHQ